MKSLTQLIEQIQPELTFETSRSSGKGGQHVNKTESRVTLVWKFDESEFLSVEERELVRTKCKHYNSGETFRISTEENRSQVKNKKLSIYKLKQLLEVAFHQSKPRKQSRVPFSVKRKRIKDKKIQSEIKNSRKKIDKRDF
mgnify:CR=1 FL=1